MLTKYKILGGAIGTAVAGYGVYESTMYFGTSRKSVGAKTEEIKGEEKFKEQDNKSIDKIEFQVLENNPEQDKPKPQPTDIPKDIKPSPDNQDLKSPTPQPPKNPLPAKVPEELPKPPVPRADANQGDYELFGNEDSGNIGWRYKNFLIGSKTSETWNRRFESWRQRSQNGAGVIHDAFLIPKNQEPTLETLQTRCQQAYRKTKWDEHISDHVLKYWSTVSIYCRHSEVSDPDDWYQG